MASKGELVRAIQKAAKTFNRNFVDSIVCTVDSVDETAYTCVCTPVDGTNSTKYENVLLSAVNNDGLILIPEVNSTVIICNSTYSSPYVAMFSDLEKILLVIGNSTLTITDGLFEFNGGHNYGMVLVADLVTKLNNLENLVNDLVSKYNLHTHVLTLTMGTGTAASTITQERTTLTPTTKENIMSTKITQ